MQLKQKLKILRKGLDTVESLSVEVKGSKILVKILPKLGLLHRNVVKRFLLLQDLPKLGLLHRNVVKTALFYSIVTLYLGLRPRIKNERVVKNREKLNFSTKTILQYRHHKTVRLSTSEAFELRFSQLSRTELKCFQAETELLIF